MRWVSRLAMTSVFMANGVAFGGWVATLPRLLEQAGLDKARLGLVLLAAAVGASVALPAAGFASQRVGAFRLAALTGLGLAAALPIAPAVAGAWVPLLAAAAALGMMLGAMDVAMNAAGAELEVAWAAPIMSSMHAGWSFGGLLGAAIAAAATAANLPLTATQASCAVAVALLVVPALVLARRRLTRRAAAGPKRRFAWPGWGLASIGALAGLCFISEATVSDWSGIYLRADLGTSDAAAATAFAAYSAAMVAGRLLGDGVVRRLGPAAVVRGGAALAASGLTLALSVTAPGWAMAGFALAGLGLSNIIPVVFSAAGRRAGGPGVALAATVGYGGLMGAPPVVGFIAEALGLRAALALVVLGLGCVALLAPAAAYRATADAA